MAVEVLEWMVATSFRSENMVMSPFAYDTLFWPPPPHYVIIWQSKLVFLTIKKCVVEDREVRMLRPKMKVVYCFYQVVNFDLVNSQD